MQTKTKQIIVIIFLGVALLSVGLFGLTQFKEGKYLDLKNGNKLSTRLFSGNKNKNNNIAINNDSGTNKTVVDKIENIKVANKNKENPNFQNNNTTEDTISKAMENNYNKNNTQVKEKNIAQKEVINNTSTPQIVKQTVVKITKTTPAQQLNYDKNSVLEENGYLRCLKDEHILQWSAGDNEWDCVRPGESVFGKAVATRSHGIRETSTGVVYCETENSLLVWENNSWRCKPYNSGSGGDNTDNQQLSLNGGTNILTLSNGTGADSAVNLSPYLDNTDLLATLNCANGEIIKWNSLTSQWECAVDAGGSGSTTFRALTDTPNNYGTNGYLVQTDGVGALSYINPSIYLDNTDDQKVDNLSLVGNILHLSLEDDGVADNTVDLSSIDTNTTYTNGNGISLTGTTFSVNSPTCAGTDKLQWNGSAFVCSADVDTNTTYSAGTGLSLTGTVFALNSGINNLTDVDTTTTPPTNGQALTWDGTNWVPATVSSGADSDWTISGNNQYSAVSGNIGIGTSTPDYKLQIAGDIVPESNRSYDLGTNDLRWKDLYLTGIEGASIHIGNFASDETIIEYDGSWRGIIFKPAPNNDSSRAFAVLNTGGSTVLGVDTSSNRIGINDASPSYSLDVNGTGRFTGTLTMGSGGTSYTLPNTDGSNGQVLQTDGSGNVSWGTVSGGGADSDWTISGNNQYSAVSGNVGIGTSTPDYKLQIAGDIVPETDNTYDLGTSTLRWQDLYLGPTSSGVGGESLHIGTNSSEAIMEYDDTTHKFTLRNTQNATEGMQFLDASNTSIMNISTLNRRVGIGTTNPTAQLHTTGTVRFSNFGAGTLQTDANGNLSVSSDERLKNIQGGFNRGLEDLLNINPIEYKWKEQTGYDTENSYYGFSAQNVKLSIPEAVGEDNRGYLTLADRPILATAINAIKELNQKQEQQNITIQSNTLKTDTNINTLQQLQTSVDKNLTIINQTLTSLGENQKSIQTAKAELNTKVEDMEENIQANTENLSTLSENINSLTKLTTTITNTITNHEERITALEKILNSNSEIQNDDQNSNPEIPKLTNLPEALNSFSSKLALIQEGTNCEEDDNDCTPTQPIFSLSGDLIVERLKAKKIEAEEVKVAGVTTTSSLRITENNADSGDNSSSVGTVTLPAGKKSVVVKTTAVTENSKIILTPKEPIPVAANNKVVGESFEVSIGQELDKELIVDWIIIGTE